MADIAEQARLSIYKAFSQGLKRTSSSVQTESKLNRTSHLCLRTKFPLKFPLTDYTFIEIKKIYEDQHKSSS